MGAAPAVLERVGRQPANIGPRDLDTGNPDDSRLMENWEARTQRIMPEDRSLFGIADKVQRGERLTEADGRALFASNDLLAIGAMADAVNRARTATASSSPRTST
jgi:DNA-binding LacI/PurR family transcriptional regulator